MKSSLEFPKNFLWGCATAAYQVEGATHVAGRSECIWDVFARTPGKVYAGENGDVAVDQYHRYPQDVALMKKLGAQAYRFSVAWPRVIPSGTGKVNQHGLDYYRRLTDCLLENGIQPAVTLYHWDLPQVLQDKGGWNVRDTAYHLAEYGQAVYEALSDRVDFWITLNEPWCSAYLGHLLGTHAPGIKDLQQTYNAIHHLNLGHGLLVQAFRQGNYKGKIGITHNLSAPRAASENAADIEAADRAADSGSRMFLNPLSAKDYPQRHLDALGVHMPQQAGDKELMAQPIDFLGINYYMEFLVRSAPASKAAPDGFNIIQPAGPVSDMDWPIDAGGLYRLMDFTQKEFGKPIDMYITENGFAAPNDVVQKGRVHDTDRICYLQDHLHACSQAIADGLPLKGYFVWSFIDNYEWAFGYSKRFGIVHCDYSTLRRTPKDSFYFMRDIMTGRRWPRTNIQLAQLDN